MSAFSVGVFDGLSALLTALGVIGDKGDGREGISPLFVVWLLFCRLVGEFANVQLCFNVHESIVFLGVIFSCCSCEPGEPVLLLHSEMYVGQCGHAEGVTFNPDRDLWHFRSVAGRRNRSKMSLIRQDRNLGQRVSLPVSLASCPIHCHPAGPCSPFHPSSYSASHACWTNRELL